MLNSIGYLKFYDDDDYSFLYAISQKIYTYSFNAYIYILFGQKPAG